jgi:acyl-CoA synthetase (AMP-forming)/AMP-acid ligase II
VTDAVPSSTAADWPRWASCPTLEVTLQGADEDFHSSQAESDGEEQLVVCCEGTAGDAWAIQEAAQACIAAQFGLSTREVVVALPGSLPRTSSGKPQRVKTRQMYLDGTLPRASLSRQSAASTTARPT